MTTPDDHRMDFTEGADAQREAARSTETASATAAKAAPKLSDMFLIPMASGVFRVSGQPEGAPQPTADQAAQMFYQATREQLDALDFDDYLKQAIEETTGGQLDISPWWMVLLGAGFIGFNAWSMSRLYRPKKEKPAKKAKPDKASTPDKPTTAKKGDVT